jgi:hypothetical protein
VINKDRFLLLLVFLLYGTAVRLELMRPLNCTNILY